MEEVEVVCEYCLESFKVQMPTTTTICCPACSMMTRVEYDSGDFIYHNWE